MKKEQVAAQLYTVRDFIKTESEIAESMKKIRDIGYTSVQISGMGPIDEVLCKKILDDNGLNCCATHEGGELLLNEPEKIVERLKKLDCKYTAFPHPGNIKTDTYEEVMDLVNRFNKAGEVYYKNGIVLTYHNHNCEFKKINGELVLDLIYNNTNPKYLQGEIDTYWVQSGGCDPIEWCKKLSGRLPLLHLKDYKINAESQIVFGEVGYGNLNWKSIVSEAEKSGCEWFIVEQDVCPGDPFDSLKMSYDYLLENICD